MKQWVNNRLSRFRFDNRSRIGLFIAVALYFMFNPYAYAGDTKLPPGSFDTTEALIQLLKEKGVIDDKEAKGFLERHRSRAKATGQIVTITSPDDQKAYLKSISDQNVQKVTEDLNNLKENYQFRSQDLVQKNILLERKVEQLEEIMKEEHLPAIQKSSWAQRIRFGGDIRLRHESVLFDKGNSKQIEDSGDPGNFINSSNDQHRQRIRLRFGVKAKIIDQTEKNVGKVEAGLRVATGNVDNPVSTNHTLGHSSRDKSDIVLDRAYIKWKYKPEEEILGGTIPQVSVTGGIMENPWLSSSLIWDSDLAFEGLTLNLKSDTLMHNTYAGFLTMGYYPLEESEWSRNDKYMLGGQIGFKHRPTYGWEYKLAAAYYDFNNVTGEPIRDATLTDETRRQIGDMSPKFMQKGNSTFILDQTTASATNLTTPGLLSEYKILNLSGRLNNTLYFPIHVQFYWDWVKNLGYDPEEMAEKTGVFTKEEIEAESGDIGYQLGLKVGYPKPRERWEWNVSLEYRYLESDAVLDAFTDSDFHLGGTNAKGWILGGELGIYHNLWLKARWMSADEIDNMEAFGDSQSDDLAVDTFQIDLNTSF